jgi:hypothetical protein
MKLSLITNNPSFARRAENAGIDRVMIDLETLGKAERQSGQNLFLTDHSFSDVLTIRNVISKSKLVVRVDPLHDDSPYQIKDVIEAGADLIMLPYFHELDEAKEFINLVDGKALPILLVETKKSLDFIEKLLMLDGLSEIHIGLNDLRLSCNKDHIFDFITDGTIDKICGVLRRSGIPFGFGGIASINRTDLPVPPSLFLAEQICQGATRGWLGRSFRELDLSSLDENIQCIRKEIDRWQSANPYDILVMRNTLRLHLLNMNR